MSFWDVCGNVANVIATALAAFSIYVSSREHRDIRKYETDRIVGQQKLLWYNEVALNDIVKQLDKCIENIEAKLKNIKNEKDKDGIEAKLQSAYNSLNEDYTVLSEKLFCLKIFQDSLYKQCDNSVQIIYDKYSEIINYAVERKHLLHISNYEIHREKVKIIEALYRFGNEFMNV